jgi:hypothetical protein
MRLWLILAAASSVLAEDPREIVRRAVAQDRPYFDRARDYNYQRNIEVKQFDRQGKVTKTETETYDVGIYYGRPYERLIARDGRPLSAKEDAREQAKMDRELAKRKRRAEEEQKVDREERRAERQAFRDIPEAFDFKLLGEESRFARKMWVIEATPRPGYRPVNDRAKLLAKMQGKMWIDQADYQLARVEAETIDTFSIGAILLRIGRGSRIVLEQSRVNDEVWLPLAITVKGDARLALIKSFRAQIDIAYRNYKKFQTESKFTVAEVQ